jgi:hypothetical protein
MGWYRAGYFLLGGYRTAKAFAAAQTRSLVGAGQMGLAYGITETVSAAAAILSAPLAGLLYEQNPIIIYPASLGMILVSFLTGLYFNPAGAKAPADEHVPERVEVS